VQIIDALQVCGQLLAHKFPYPNGESLAACLIPLIFVLSLAGSFVCFGYWRAGFVFGAPPV